jgi:hypothetical protein
MKFKQISVSKIYNDIIIIIIIVIIIHLKVIIGHEGGKLHRGAVWNSTFISYTPYEEEN